MPLWGDLSILKGSVKSDSKPCLSSWQEPGEEQPFFTCFPALLWRQWNSRQWNSHKGLMPGLKGWFSPAAVPKGKADMAAWLQKRLVQALLPKSWRRNIIYFQQIESACSYRQVVSEEILLPCPESDDHEQCSHLPGDTIGCCFNPAPCLASHCTETAKTHFQVALCNPGKPWSHNKPILC